MAKRIENECAFCAEDITASEEVIGKDWKVYCSERCADAGEKMSFEEWRKAMESGADETRRQGDGKIPSPCLPVPLSLYLLTLPFLYVEFNAG